MINKNVNSLDRSPDVTNIEYEHIKIWLGMAFKLSDKQSIASGANLDFLIQIPATLRLVHIYGFGLQVESLPMTMSLYEAPSFSAAGTPLTARNINRLSDTTSLITVSRAPTITAVGTLIGETYLLGDKQESGGGDFENHVVLNPAHDYLLRINNGTVSPANAAIHMGWFEE